MEIYWYLIIVFVLAVYFILDGYDFGVGIIHLFMAKDEKDKKVIAKAAGLYWDSNEVWFIAGGGLLFLAFPVLYASAFSGFYLPLIIVLWLFVFRAISLELRNHWNNNLWTSFWDFAFGISSLLLALFFGIALGNVVRGVNLGGVVNGQSIYEAHYFFLPLWNSTFSPMVESVGVIDWFTLIIGLIAVVVLAMHGAAWIILKTNSSINEKLKKVVQKLDIILIILTIVSLIAWLAVKPDALNNFFTKPYLLILPIIYFIGLLGLLLSGKISDKKRFLYTSLVIVGGIASSVASIFPTILPSTNNINPDLTIYNTVAHEYGLSIAIVWIFIGLALLAVYFITQHRLMKGKIDDMMDYGH
ncbi:MAG TPA: cytochrome d ubiquinol oxidase subunit II [Flavobacteriia bacterium]|nr:cytochrome d ubiquinol oxidase subunit II [Flavobacteriia bacterium]